MSQCSVALIKCLCLTILLFMISGCASGVKPTTRRVTQLRFHNNYLERSGPFKVHVFEKQSLDEGEKIAGEIVGKVEAILSASDKYQVVEKKDAEVLVRVGGVYFGDNPAEATKYMPEWVKRDLKYTNGIEIASDVGGLTGKALAIASLKGAVAMNPLTGLGISLTSKALPDILSWANTDVRPFLGRIYVVYEEPGMNLMEGLPEPPPNRWTGNYIESFDAPKKKIAFDPIVDRMVGHILLTMFNEREIGKMDEYMKELASK